MHRASFGGAMSKLSNEKLTGNARMLRKNMTKEERHLWYDFLKNLPVMVHRQKVVEQYIVDFYIAQCSLVIELDGSQHYMPEEAEKDAIRTKRLQDKGLLVVRIPNNEVSRNFRGVCEYLDDLIKSRMEH